MEWKFSKNSITVKNIEALEKDFAVNFPEKFKEIIIKHNGARPSLSGFNLENEKGKVFDSLISYQLDDENNVIDYYNIIKYKSSKKIIPFGEDPFGNLLCFLYKNKDNPSVIFCNQEKENDERFNKVAGTFVDFMNKLYEI